MIRNQSPRRLKLGASLLAKRSIVVNGHKTSASIERPFWDALREIAVLSNINMETLISKIDRHRQHSNLSSCIRLFVLDFYQSGRAGYPLTEKAKAPGLGTRAE
jgi:predicted DNA-binding ribbon-helix-helix protein